MVELSLFGSHAQGIVHGAGRGVGEWEWEWEEE
jgi:hypothetical protein